MGRCTSAPRGRGGPLPSPLGARFACPPRRLQRRTARGSGAPAHSPGTPVALRAPGNYNRI